MRLTGTLDELWNQLATLGAAAAVEASEHIPGLCRRYQYAALYALAGRYDGGRILEIGCFHGRSAFVMSMAAPAAEIVTISPDGDQVAAARQNLAERNVRVIQSTAVDFWKRNTSEWDMVFVDGNHRQVSKDLVWFNQVRPGGLMLFHDYTPADAKQRSHVEVVNAVDALAARLGRELDVLVMDDLRVGMAGLYRREGETWR